MRNPPLELHVVQAAVSDVDDDGIAVINCQTTSGPRVCHERTRLVPDGIHHCSMGVQRMDVLARVPIGGAELKIVAEKKSTALIAHRAGATATRWG